MCWKKVVQFLRDKMSFIFQKIRTCFLGARRFSSKISKAWKTVSLFRPLVFGFIVFFFITACVLWRASLLTEDNYSSFVISLAASFLEDLIFFVLIGVVAIIVSTRDPSEEHIERRARWLFNGSNFDEEALKYVRDQATLLAIYSSDCRITITFEESHPDGKTVKAHIRSCRKFANLMSDTPSTFFMHEYQAIADDVYDKEINGELLALVTGVGDSRKEWMRTPKPLPIGGHKNSVNIEIKGDGENVFEHAFWVWYKIGEKFEFMNKHYTTKVLVCVVNQSDKTIVLKDLRKDSQAILTKGQDVVYTYEHIKASKEAPFELIGVK